MEHQTKLLWMHSAIVVQPQPSPRGRRVAGLVFRGTLIGLAAVSEDDWQVAFQEAGLFTDAMKGGSANADSSTSHAPGRTPVQGRGHRRDRPPSSGYGRAARGTPIALTTAPNGDARAADPSGGRAVDSDPVRRPDTVRVD